MKNVNLNQLSIFLVVYKNRSMTKAADQLHMTQSGVSQHMKVLEDSIGIKLFDRVKQRLIPTDKAHQLYQKCSESLNEIESTIFNLGESTGTLSGMVTLGVPVEFGNNIVMPLIGEFGQEHPTVEFRVIYDFATVLTKQLLAGEMDFAFVDSVSLDSRIKTQVVYNEQLHLCASPEYLKKAKTKLSGLEPQGRTRRRFFEVLDYIDYQPGEPILRMWFDHHLGSRQLDVRARATAMDVQGVSKLILGGMGVGVLPGHLVDKVQKEGHKLSIFERDAKPLQNAISLAQIEGRTLSAASDQLKEYLTSRIPTE